MAPVLRRTHHDTELVSQVRQALLARPERILMKATEQKLNAVRQERIVRVGLHDRRKDLLVRRTHKRLEHHHNRHHVLLLSPAKTQRHATIVQIVHRVGDTDQVVPTHASDRACLVRIGRAAARERRALNGHDVIRLGQNQESDQTLVAVDNKIAAHLIRLLVLRDELLGRHATQMASVRADHDRHETHIPQLTLLRSIVDTPCHTSRQPTTVRHQSVPAFVRIHAAIQCILRAIRHHRPTQRDSINPHLESIASRRTAFASCIVKHHTRCQRLHTALQQTNAFHTELVRAARCVHGRILGP